MVRALTFTALALLSTFSHSSEKAEQKLRSLGWEEKTTILGYTHEDGWFGDRYRNAFGKKVETLGYREGLLENDAGTVKLYLMGGLVKRSSLTYNPEGRGRNDIKAKAGFELQLGDEVMITAIPTRGILLRYYTYW